VELCQDVHRSTQNALATPLRQPSAIDWEAGSGKIKSSRFPPTLARPRSLSGSLYQPSKWGIEGFMDAVGQEVATFNIGVTIVEPGGALRRSRSLVQVTWSFARFRRSRGLICHSGRRHSLEAQPLLKAERTPRIAASA